MRIHAPYTHVPYHQRLDDEVVKFVSNDHCLRSTPSVTIGASLALIAYAVALVMAAAVLGATLRGASLAVVVVAAALGDLMTTAGDRAGDATRGAILNDKMRAA